MRVSDVISNVTKQNKTWTSWRQGTKLRVRLSLANARFASLLSKVMYIIKRKFKCLSWIWLLFHLVKWKNVYFIRAFGTHEIYIFFTSLDEIKVIFTPNIWISSIYSTWDRVSSTIIPSKHINVAGTSLQRRCNDVAATLKRRCCDVVCLMGLLSTVSVTWDEFTITVQIQMMQNMLMKTFRSIFVIWTQLKYLYLSGRDDIIC